MNILQVNSSLGWSGGQEQVLLLSKGLAERGHQVIIAAPPESELCRRAREAGIPVEGVDISRKLTISPVRRLKEILVNKKIDLVNSHKPLPHFFALLAVLWAKTPALVASRRVSFPISKNLFSYLKWKMRVDTFIAVSEEVKKSLLSFGIAPENVEVIYSGVDLKRFDPVISGETVRKEYGIDPATPLVGQVANYIAWKGYDIFFQAVKLVIEKFPHAKFLAVGRETSYVEEMRTAAKELGIDQQLIFTGFRRDMPEIYAALDVTVSASLKGEGLAGVLRESLAMETPVVASDVGGNREIVINGKTGFCIPSADPYLLAERIIWLLSHREEAKSMGKEGRRLVKEHFTVEHMVARTEQVYWETLQRRTLCSSTSV